jgi:dienelactone hydrolase
VPSSPGAAAEAPDFNYRKSSAAIAEIGRKNDAATIVRDVSFEGEGGQSIGAYLIEPAKGCGPAGCAGILFVHWLEPAAANSNRTQFLSEARELAARGAVALLVDTMWSDKDWFDKRNPDRDIESSLQQVRNLRHALDVLLAQPGVDSGRVACVGHDFGMMYGALVIGVDHRVKVAALQAGTSDFSDWFLLGRKLSPEATQAVKDNLSGLAPVRYLPLFHGPILLQFGKKDPYVPAARALALEEAANEPKQIRFYDCGHAMNAEAEADRDQWLRAALKRQ